MAGQGQDALITIPASGDVSCVDKGQHILSGYEIGSHGDGGTLQYGVIRITQGYCRINRRWWLVFLVGQSLFKSRNRRRIIGSIDHKVYLRLSSEIPIIHQGVCENIC